jgi:hypothetical protein
MTREEFHQHLDQHPQEKDIFESLYTVITRKTGHLTALHYHEYYRKETDQMAKYLKLASSFSKNKSLKKYLVARSKSIRSDRYYQSDLLWMDLEKNLIDIVIGPIENYEDRLFNYKAAYEAAVMIKDISATNELEVYKQHLPMLERNLPIDNKFKKKSVGSSNLLEIVNIIYFGGDFQAGVKTIAASLPNDERVISKRGAKKQLYKNIMEAKYEQILTPIADLMIEEHQRSFLSSQQFISQVLLHEISHTIGPAYVSGSSDSVRKTLRDKYSIIEECKADILGIFAVNYFKDVFTLDIEIVMQHYVTYVAGLFRSIRFGIEEAHGSANLMQLNYLLKHNVIVRNPTTGKYSINAEGFHEAVAVLAAQLLMIEVEGNYDDALRLIDAYGNFDNATKEDLGKLQGIPSDLDLKFNLDY